MNDDILLTPDEIDAAAIKEPFNPFDSEAMYSQDLAICRAQVRKVVEWGNARCADHGAKDLNRFTCPFCNHALKAAGEGK